MLELLDGLGVVPLVDEDTPELKMRLSGHWISIDRFFVLVGSFFELSLALEEVTEVVVRRIVQGRKRQSLAKGLFSLVELTLVSKQDAVIVVSFGELVGGEGHQGSVVLLGLLGLPDFGVQNQQVQVSLRERGIKVEGLLGFGDGIVNAANLFELNTALEMRRRTHVERPEFGRRHASAVKGTRHCSTEGRTCWSTRYPR